MNSDVDSLPVAVRAAGSIVTDSLGVQYLDGSSGAVCANIGHARPEVISAIKSQIGELAYVHRTQFDSVPKKKLIERILDVTGPSFTQVVFSNSGSEANEAAFRLALIHQSRRNQTRRSVVLSHSPSYHGMTAGALSASGFDARKSGLDPMAVPAMTDGYVVPQRAGDLVASVDDWASAIDRIGASRIAAVIVEPVGGASTGACVMPPEVLQFVRRFCDDTGALMISDEVMSGFGRTGKMFGFCHSGVTPDVITAGKGLSGGYTPIGVTVIRPSVVKGLSAEDLSFGHTLSGNPLSCAIALAVLNFTIENDLESDAVASGQYLKRELTRICMKSTNLGEVRGQGMLLAATLPCGRDEPPRNNVKSIAQSFTQVARRNRLILYPAGADYRYSSVIVSPPLTTPADVLEQMIAQFERTVQEFDSMGRR
jgi:adenosylmethionine-8-amino-7-oxononanoate aminotransferase